MHAKTGIKEVFMKALRISENVYWVGAIDWNVRNFHGYETEKGTTYNAYLILDERSRSSIPSRIACRKKCSNASAPS